jgi:hypothetical protein
MPVCRDSTVHHLITDLKERTLDDFNRVLGAGHTDMTRLQASRRISRDLEA